MMTNRYKVATSPVSNSDSESVSSRNVHPIDGTFSKMVETGQIGFRLAEEIKTLREELLVVKQEKRILLVNNENLEDSLANANRTITDMHTRLADLQARANYSEVELSKKESTIKTDENEIGFLKKQLSGEKKKNRLLGEELERSLEDEVTLRSYSRRLEQDLVALKEAHSVAGEASRSESEQRAKCEQFIDTALRSQLIFQKKLETVVYYCDKDVDINSVSILDVSPDYLESLLRDTRSEKVDGYRGSAPQGAIGVRTKLDFSVLEHKQKLIDHHLNQYLNNIREHVSKHRKSQAKSHRHIRRLLEVVRTYEELPLAGGPSLQAYRPERDWFADDSGASVGSGYPNAERNRERAQLRRQKEELCEKGSGLFRLSDRNGDHEHSTVDEHRQLYTGQREQNPAQEHQIGQTESAPPSRHPRSRENSPSPARDGPFPGRRHGSRTLVLLEQLQREMERELRV